MSALDKVRDSLKARHPDLRYTEKDGTLMVHAPAPGGFDVWITNAGREWIVGYDCWHEHFDAEDKALDCFAFGFSDRCRLRVTLRGHFAYKWTMESLEEGKWVEDSTTGLFLFPFWRAPRVEYRQNRLLKRS